MFDSLSLTRTVIIVNDVKSDHKLITSKAQKATSGEISLRNPRGHIGDAKQDEYSVLLPMHLVIFLLNS